MAVWAQAFLMEKRQGAIGESLTRSRSRPVWESTASRSMVLLAPRRAKSRSLTRRRARSHGDVPASKAIAKCLAGAEDDKNVPIVPERLAGSADFSWRRL